MCDMCREAAGKTPYPTDRERLDAALVRAVVAEDGRRYWEGLWKKAGASVLDLQAQLEGALIRIGDLEAALRDALDGLEEMRSYVPDYFAEKWDHDSYITRAKKALGR